MKTKPYMKVIGRPRKLRGGLEAMNGLLKLAIDLRDNKPFAAQRNLPIQDL